MRAIAISALSLSLTGCISMTTSGTEEAVYFAGKDSPSESAHAVLKPYADLPLSLEFACPSKLATMSTFYVIPLPPVIPIGFVNRKVSYLRVTMPEGAGNLLARTRIVTPQGAAISLANAGEPQRTTSKEGTFEATYALDKECEALDGGVLELAAFSYGNRGYPASQVRLQFDSRIRGSIGWWPPASFNGGKKLSGEVDTARAASR